MKILNDNITVIFSFPNNKIKSADRDKLANQFSNILRANVLICDMDCKITVIQHKTEV